MEQNNDDIEKFETNITLGDISSIYGEGKPINTKPEENTETPKGYDFLKEIARGGIGKVLLWKDLRLQRNVATKLLRKDKGRVSDIVAQRFIEEGQIAGQLEHPNIIPVYETGVHNKDLFFTMKYVDGYSLSDLLKRLHDDLEFRNEWSLNKMLQVFLCICYAVEYAHSKNVVHRDLKPDNVMIGKFGETILADWGLAKVIDQGEEVIDASESINSLRNENGFTTIAGNIVGTPSYMSPEQAWGRLEEIDHRSDIFSLGLILYEMITAQKAISGKNIHNIIHNIVTNEINTIPKKGIFGPINKELASIIQKCLQSKKEDRYDSVRKLSRDIQNLMEDKNVSAHNYNTWDYTSKFFSRYHSEILLFIVAFIMAFLCFNLWSSVNTRKKVNELTQDGHGLLQRSDKHNKHMKTKLIFQGIGTYRDAYKAIQCSSCREKLYEFNLYEAEGWKKLFYEAKKANNVEAMLFAQQRIKHLIYDDDYKYYKDILDVNLK